MDNSGKSRGRSEEENITLKGSRTSEEAVSLLLQRFPWLPNVVGEELQRDESHYVYARFVEVMQMKIDDDAFLKSACGFISWLADQRDPFLTDVLVTSVFENIVYAEALAGKLKPLLGSAALDLLQAVEENLL